MMKRLPGLLLAFSLMACSHTHPEHGDIVRLESQLADERERTDMLAERVELLSAEVQSLRAALTQTPPGNSLSLPDGLLDTSGEVAVVRRSLLPEDMRRHRMRMVPHADANGDYDGMRVSGIRRGSLWDGLGLKNGDIVHAINQTPFTDRTQGLATLDAVFDGERAQMLLTRRGEPQTMTFVITD